MNRSKHRPTRALALLALLAGAGAVAAQDSPNARATEAAAAASMDDARDPLLGPPLVINGERVSDAEIRRQVVLGSKGRSLLDYSKLRVFIEEEIERRVAAGADRASITVSQADVDKAINDAEEHVQNTYGDELSLSQLYPTEDELWQEQVTLTQAFSRLFLPDNPDEFPPLTLEALRSTSTGEKMIEHLKADYERMQQPGEEPDPIGQTMVKMLLNQSVMKHLEDSSEIVSGDALPVEVALRVNGKDILVDDMWRKLYHRIGPTDVEAAKRWIANVRLAKADLKASGHWISDEEDERIYQEYAAPYEGSPFSIEAVARKFQKFPTQDAFREYFRISESYRRRLRDDLRSAVLEKHEEEIDTEARAKLDKIVADRKESGETMEQSPEELFAEIREDTVEDWVDERYTNQLMRVSATRTSRLAGDANVKADIILLSAYDFVKQTWKENGWAEARERCLAVVEELEGGLPWKQAVEKYSEFYDQPMPPGASEPEDQQVLKDKGRFRAVTRNQLMKLLDESVYSAFVYHESVTDFVFFDLKAGTVGDPIRGPFGWYIPRLHVRGAPRRVLEVNDPSYRELIEQDFLQMRLNKYVQQLYAENEIEGLTVS